MLIQEKKCMSPFWGIVLLGDMYVYVCVCVFTYLYAYVDTYVPTHTSIQPRALVACLGCTPCESCDAVHHPRPCAGSAQAAAITRCGNAVLQIPLV